MTNDRDYHIGQSIRNGDRSAMADLYHRHIGYLAAVCSRYLSSDEDVKDVLQTSFLKILSSLDRFDYRGQGSLRAWMTRITVNETLKSLRGSDRTRRLQDACIREDAVDGEPDTEDIPQDVLHKMIRELPDGYRTVFNLYVFEEKSHREIASMLGISEGTSASQFHRAKALLASRIRKWREQNL